MSDLPDTPECQLFDIQQTIRRGTPALTIRDGPYDCRVIDIWRGVVGAYYFVTIELKHVHSNATIDRTITGGQFAELVQQARS